MNPKNIVLVRRHLLVMFFLLLVSLIAGIVCLRVRGQCAAVCLTNHSGNTIATASIKVFGASPSQIDVFNILPNETRAVRFISRAFSGYSMSVKLANVSEYRTEERVALNGHRVTESIGSQSSNYSYDWISFLYDEDSKFKFPNTSPQTK